MALSGKKKKRSAFYAPIAFILIIVALVFGMSVFFRVSNIEIVGNSIYTGGEIIDASGISEGDNLFFLNRIKAQARVLSRLPYVETATISRDLPSSITIEITESAALAYLANEDGLWSIDRNCKVLANVSAQSFSSLIQVIGLKPISPTAGEYAAAGDAESGKVSYLKEILGMIYALDLQADIASIDMSNAANPTFEYLGRFSVKLGSHADVDYKFQLMIACIEKLKGNEHATLDLSNGTAHLTYD